MSQLTDCTNSLTARDILRGAARTGPPFYINVLGLSGLCAEYQIAYAAMTNKPGATDKTRQNALVCNLVDIDMWTNQWDVFVMNALHTNAGGEAVMNFISPGTYDGTLVGVIDPAFVAYQGFTGSPITSSYIETNFNPSLHGVKYQLDDSSFFVYIRTNSDGNYCDIGIDDGSNDAWLFSRNGDLSSIRINDSGTDFNANTDSRGLYVISRTAANARNIYKNGALHGSDAQASTALSNKTFFVLARHQPPVANVTDRENAVYGFGKSVAVGKQSDFKDIIEEYMDSYGTGVIP